VARTVGGRVTDTVIKDLSCIGYLVEAKAPEGPYFEPAATEEEGVTAATVGSDAGGRRWRHGARGTLAAVRAGLPGLGARSRR
jgi:hypothetical protein